MNLKKIFQCGFIVACCFNETIAMDENPKTNELRTTFKRPTIKQIQGHAINLKESQPWSTHASVPFILTIEGIIFEAQVDLWDQPNIVQKALRLEKNGDTCWIENKHGSFIGRQLRLPIADNYGCR